MKLYINGKIHSMDTAGGVHSALLVKDGAIADIGKSEELTAKYPEAEKIDLGGQVVIPGIIDTHTHIFASAYSEKTRELVIHKSVGALLTELRERVKTLNPGEWVVYKNTYPLRLDELRYPTLAELDETAPDNPVVVDGYYSSQLNTAALRTIDFDKLPRGAGIEYDDEGNMTGLIKCANPYITSFIDFGNGSEEDALRSLMREYNKCGITMGVEAMGSVDNIKTMKKLQDAGEQTVRVRYTLPAVPAVAESAMKTDAGDRGFARVEFLKNFLDGGFLTGTAFMEYPYLRQGLKEIFGIDTRGEDDYGMVLFTVEELADSIRLARKYRLKYGAHCVGSGASQRLLEAYKLVDGENPIKGERHSLIHADFMDEDAINRANDMGISVLFQPAWHYMDAHALDRFIDPRDISRFMKYDVILKANLAAAGSDHMVKHDPNESVNPYNPFLGMYNMVTCRSRDGKQYGAEGCVSREEALVAYTRDAARVCFDENDLGTLAVGKRADFAVLDRDYFTCPEKEIPEIRATMTVVDGKRVW